MSCCNTSCFNFDLETRLHRAARRRWRQYPDGCNVCAIGMEESDSHVPCPYYFRMVFGVLCDILFDYVSFSIVLNFGIVPYKPVNILVCFLIKWLLRYCETNLSSVIPMNTNLCKGSQGTQSQICLRSTCMYST